VTGLQARLGSAVFQDNLDAGRKLSIEQVQAEALAIARQVVEMGKSQTNE